MASSCPTCGQSLPYPGPVRPKVKKENRNPFCQGHRKSRAWPCSCYPPCLECEAQVAAGKPDTHRFEHADQTFVSRLVTFAELPDEVKNKEIARIQAELPDKRCCGLRMGVAPDGFDLRHWIYQCEANTKHTQDYRVRSAA